MRKLSRGGLNDSIEVTEMVSVWLGSELRLSGFKTESFTMTSHCL